MLVSLQCQNFWARTHICMRYTADETWRRNREGWRKDWKSKIYAWNWVTLCYTGLHWVTRTMSTYNIIQPYQWYMERFCLSLRAWRTHPTVVLPITTPTLLSQVHIPTLTQSPRNSQTLYAPTTISASVKSLLSFKDLMVDRKRIAIGQVLKEGEWGGVWVWRWGCESCG